MFSILITYVMGYSFYILSIAVHILVIYKLLPFNWINGGRSESFEKQKQVSVSSSFILLVGLALILLSQLIPSIRTTLFFSILFFVLTALWTFSLVLQLLGTKFERYGMSVIVLMGILSHLSLALLYFS